MKRLSMISTAVLALGFSLGSAWAQSSSSTGSSAGGGTAAGATTAPAAQAGTGTRNKETRKDDKLARGDRKFVEEAAGSGMFEVQAAQLASTRATDPAVKSFATMLVDQHTKANNELTQLANSKGVEVPPAPPRALRNRLDDLGKKKDAEFDREFVREVGIKEHEKDVKAFEKASKDLKDPELKAFAEKTLPTLREHLAAAQKLPQAGRDMSKDAKAGGSDAKRMGNTGGGAATGSGGTSGANKSGS